MNYSSGLINRAVERLTGLSADYIRKTPLDKLRQYFENRCGERMRISGVESKIIDVLGEKIRVIQL